MSVTAAQNGFCGANTGKLLTLSVEGIEEELEETSSALPQPSSLTSIPQLSFPPHSAQLDPAWLVLAAARGSCYWGLRTACSLAWILEPFDLIDSTSAHVIIQRCCCFVIVGEDNHEIERNKVTLGIGLDNFFLITVYFLWLLYFQPQISFIPSSAQLDACFLSLVLFLPRGCLLLSQPWICLSLKESCAMSC